MTIRISGIMAVKCEECDRVIEIDRNSVDFEQYSEDRQMGPETAYHGTIELPCDNCGNNMTIEVSVWEYPENCFNDDDYSAHGCTISIKFDIDIGEEQPE